MLRAYRALPELGVATVKDAIGTSLPPAGRWILDVGCGNGALMRWLAGRGATMFGVEANPALLLGTHAAGGITLPGQRIAARAEHLPFAARGLDAVLFLNSLHHVPPARQVAALAEAARVLRPDGDLLVIEPLAAGGYFELLAPLDDETAVRAAAWRALKAVAGRLFACVIVARFSTIVAVPDLEAVLKRFASADPARERALDRVRPVIASRFAALGTPQPDGKRHFEQPMTLHHYRTA